MLCAPPPSPLAAIIIAIDDWGPTDAVYIDVDGVTFGPYDRNTGNSQRLSRPETWGPSVYRCGTGLCGRVVGCIALGSSCTNGLWVGWGEWRACVCVFVCVCVCVFSGAVGAVDISTAVQRTPTVLEGAWGCGSLGAPPVPSTPRALMHVCGRPGCVELPHW